MKLLTCHVYSLIYSTKKIGAQQTQSFWFPLNLEGSSCILCKEWLIMRLEFMGFEKQFASKTHDFRQWMFVWLAIFLFPSRFSKVENTLKTEIKSSKHAHSYYGQKKSKYSKDTMFQSQLRRSCTCFAHKFLIWLAIFKIRKPLERVEKPFKTTLSGLERKQAAYAKLVRNAASADVFRESI